MRRDGRHRAGPRFKLNIQIVGLPVDTPGRGKRAVSIVGKVDHPAAHHGVGRVTARLCARASAFCIPEGEAGSMAAGTGETAGAVPSEPASGAG